MSQQLQTPIEFLKGVGPQRADLLKKEVKIFTYKDLLVYFPFRYVDRTFQNTISDIPQTEGFIQINGKIIRIEEKLIGKRSLLTVLFEDHTGSIELTWFQGIKWIKPKLNYTTVFQVYGKPKLFANKYAIPHPEIIPIQDAENKTGIKPIYSSTEKLATKGLHTKGIEKLTHTLITEVKPIINETLSPTLLTEFNLISKQQALYCIHNPDSKELLDRAIFRLKFEELFYLQMELLLRKQISVQKTKGFIFKEVGDHFLSFYNNHLPFELTNAQKKVIREIRNDFKTGHHMNRLLQGDVGSGKTLVALLSMLISTGNGYQSLLMAPTEILAQQHFESISDLVKNLPISCVKLTGSVKKSERKIILPQIEDGTIQLVIGTHALLEDTVKFKNIGLVIIDEQHRFGVAQRAKLWKKNSTPPHILVMTATPIPRTLAMTAYGDLDVSIIDE